MAVASFQNRQCSLICICVDFPSFSGWIHSEVELEKEYECTTFDDRGTVRYWLIHRNRSDLKMGSRDHHAINKFITIDNIKKNVYYLIVNLVKYLLSVRKVDF